MQTRARLIALTPACRGRFYMAERVRVDPAPVGDRKQGVQARIAIGEFFRRPSVTRIGQQRARAKH